MEISHLFEPIENQQVLLAGKDSPDTLCHLINKYIDVFPNLSQTNIAIFGIGESRGSKDNNSCSKGPDYVRQMLCNLKRSNVPYRVADLGNLRPGETLEHTYKRIQDACNQLIKNNIIPVLIGGSHDLAYAQYRAYQGMDMQVTVVNVDSSFDLEEEDKSGMNKAHIQRLLLHDPNYLFNYSHLGFQSFLVTQKEIDTLEKLKFDFIRIGDLKKNLENCEPLIRFADMVSMDMSSVRLSDSPGCFHAHPFGLSGEEACQISWYAGMSDKVTSFGIYEYNPDLDIRMQSARVTATMLWYFIEGYYHRRHDRNFNSNQFVKYTVTLKQKPHSIVFYKSTLTDRWWMEVPFPQEKFVYQRSSIVPCSYQDYQATMNGDIPDRWLKTHSKFV